MQESTQAMTEEVDPAIIFEHSLGSDGIFDGGCWRMCREIRNEPSMHSTLFRRFIACILLDQERQHDRYDLSPFLFLHLRWQDTCCVHDVLREMDLCHQAADLTEVDLSEIGF